MKVLITGATGMIGKGVLEQCLVRDEITEIVSLTRRITGEKSSKLTEVIIDDFINLAGHEEYLGGVDVVYYCLGAYTNKVSTKQFRKITVDYPKVLSETLAKYNPQVRFCLLSGAGVDRNERSIFSFSRYKGEIENYLSSVHKEFYSIRPSYIYPVEVRKEPNFSDPFTRALYPLIRCLGPEFSIPSDVLSMAMAEVGIIGAETEIIDNSELLKIGTMSK